MSATPPRWSSVIVIRSFANGMRLAATSLFKKIPPHSTRAKQIGCQPMRSLAVLPEENMLRTSRPILTALFLSSLLAGCANNGLGDKQPPLSVTIPQDCELLAKPVEHSEQTGEVVRGKTDARVAYELEYDKVETANERLASTRSCQERQRLKFYNGGK